MSFQPTRILVGMDFSDAAESACRLATSIAGACDALVDLVHVFDVFDEIFVHHRRDVLDSPDALMDIIDSALAHRARLTRVQGVRATHTSLVGVPGLELAIHGAATNADLIVLGDSGEEEGPFGVTWGRRAADQIVRSKRWHGTILLRPTDRRERR